MLFVHGIGEPAAASALRTSMRPFQPWVYYYPSGGSLSLCAGISARRWTNLRPQYGVKRFVVVAHSMGGLVARAFILRFLEARAQAVEIFVTLATPWGGHKSAGGVGTLQRWCAPGTTWRRTVAFYGDLPQDPDTVQRRRTFPRSLAHHLLVAFNRNSASFGASDDRVVTVASQLRAEAQQSLPSVWL